MSKIYIATDSSPVDMQSYELCCDMIDVVIDVSCIYGYVLQQFVRKSFYLHNKYNYQSYIRFSLREDLEAAAFDNQSSSLIKLNNGTILYLREVNKFLALVCILREDNFDRQGNIKHFNTHLFKKLIITLHNNYRSNFSFQITGVIDYNFLCFRKAIQQVFELRNKALTTTNVNNHSTPPINLNETTNAPTVSQSGTMGQNGTVVIAQSFGQSRIFL